MQELNFCIVGKPKSYEVLRFRDEVEKRGHTCFIAGLKTIESHISENKFFITADGKSLEDFDIIFMRGGTQFSSYIGSLQSPRRVVFEYKNFFSKYRQYIAFTHAGVNAPQTVYIGKFFTEKRMPFIETEIAKLGYPVIVKEINQDRGNFVFKCNNFDEVVQLVQNHPKNMKFIAQEMIGNKEDLRVIVLGDNVLGAMVKKATGEDFRTNVAQGSTIASYPLTPQIETLARKAARAVGCEFGGVDIMFHNGTPYVLEVNESPQFHGFESTTNVNLAGAIADYLIDKYTALLS